MAIDYIALFLDRLTRDEVQRYYERYIGPYYTCDGRVDLNVAQRAVDAVATELGVAAASVDQMYQPAQQAAECHYRPLQTRRFVMKIVVIGGSGLIGKKLVNNLRQRGHQVVAASPSSGVNTLTREGLPEALTDAEVVVDVANAPSWEDKAVMEFFETSGRNLLAAEATAKVRHHLALSVVGTERLIASGYFRAKLAQENLIKASRIPYTIVRATQFFEFVGGIGESASDGHTIRLRPAMMQPIAADDVAAALADIAAEEPLNGTIELAGPEKIRMDELVRRFLSAKHDARQVTTDVEACYFGIKVNDQSLTPGDHPRIGPTHFDDWLDRSASASAGHAAPVREQLASH